MSLSMFGRRRVDAEGEGPLRDRLDRDAGQGGVGEDAAAGVVDPEDEFAFDRLAALLQIAEQALDIGDRQAEDLGDLFGALAPDSPARRSDAVWTGPPIARHFAVTRMRCTGICIGIEQRTVIARRLPVSIGFRLRRPLDLVGGVTLFDALVDEPGDVPERFADAAFIAAGSEVVMISRSWARLTATLIRFGVFRNPATVVAGDRRG